MTTRNIVPQNNGEGGIGTAAKNWLNGYITNLFSTAAVLSGVFNENAVTLPSATSMSIGAAIANVINVTGPATINAFDTVQYGTYRELIFNGTLTITYNATSMILPGSTNLTVNAGDVVGFRSLGGGNWKCVLYEPIGTWNLQGQKITGLAPGVNPTDAVNVSQLSSNPQGLFTNLKVSNNYYASFTGTTSTSSLIVTSVSSTVGLAVGMVVFGTNIPAGTTITAIGSGQITLSADPTTSTSGVALTAGYGNTQTVVTANSVVLSNGTNSYTATNVNVTLNTALNGINGLDTGTLAASTMYNHFVIYNPTTLAIASLMSLSATNPTLPSGYTYFARTGAVRVDSNKWLMRTLQNDCDVQYVATPNTNTTTIPTMASGSASAGTPVAYATYVPSTASRIRGTLYITTNEGAGVAPNTSITLNTYGIYCASGTVAGVYTWMPFDFMFENSTYIYWFSAGGCTLYCSGWRDNL